MNGKTLKSQQIEERQIQEETNQKKTFVQDIFNINYVNTSKIYYQPSAVTSDVKVNNYLCYQEGQNLYKVTQIIYEDKLIRIQDRFQVNVDPQKLNSTTITTHIKKQKAVHKNGEKVRIFSKDAKKNGKMEKKDKKNIVKNIIKIFMSWLQKKQGDKHGGLYQVASNQLEKQLGNQNFNNRLIKNIVGNKNINKVFLCFLSDDAEDQIKYSRIQDKQSHYEAIQLYISLLAENKNESLKYQDLSESHSQQISSSDYIEHNDGSGPNKGQNKSQNNLEQKTNKHTRNSKPAESTCQSNPSISNHSSNNSQSSSVFKNVGFISQMKQPSQNCMTFKSLSTNCAKQKAASSSTN